MGKRYLHEALRNASINPVLYYSVEDVARLIESLNAPIPTTGIAMRKNLRMFARRNIHDEFSKKSDDGKHYLGGAWLYPINHVHPNSLSELREMHRNASFLVSEKEETMPRDQERFSSTAYSKQSKYRSKKAALFLSLFGAAAFLIAAYKLNGYQRFIRQTPNEFSSSIHEGRPLSVRERYLLAENLLNRGKNIEAEAQAFKILNFRNLLPREAGDAYFLLAKIAHRRGDNKAIENFLSLSDREYANSGNSFVANSNNGKRRNLRSFRASLSYDSHEYEKGIAQFLFLYETEVDQSSDVHQGYIALMISDGFFWLSDYGKSLEWGTIALTHYRNAGNQVGIVNATLNKAWLLLVRGEKEKGASLLNQAKTSSRRIGYDNLEPLIKITEALAAKCDGREYDLTAQSTEPRYKAYCQFVEGFSCSNTMRIVDNNPPPQQDPPPGAGTGRIVAQTSPPQADPRPKDEGQSGRNVADTPPPPK